MDHLRGLQPRDVTVAAHWVRLFTAVRFRDSATCVVLPEASVFALQVGGRAVTKLVLGYQSLDVRESFLIFTSFNENASVLRIQLAVFSKQEGCVGLPRGNAIYMQVEERAPFLLNACELSFPVTTCIAAQGTEVAQSAFARRGYGTLKHNWKDYAMRL